jgi:hypothetical protein
MLDLVIMADTDKIIIAALIKKLFLFTFELRDKSAPYNF